MSRAPRAGTPGKLVNVRVTDAERELWQAAADAAGARSLSDALRPAITRWAVGVVELKLPPGRRKSRLLANAEQIASPSPGRLPRARSRRA